MTENLSIMPSFTPTSYNYVELADGSRTPIQGIGTATTTATLPLSLVLDLPRFSYNLLSVSKIITILNCIVTFFPTRCVFQELETGKTIGAGLERNRLYELEFDIQSGGLHQHFYSIGLSMSVRTPFFTNPKTFFRNLNQVSFLKCESCQLRKHHRMSYPVG